MLTDVGPLTTLSQTGVPALNRFLDQSVPWLTRLKPYFGQLIPVIDYINLYRRELAAFFANSAASTQGIQPDLEQVKELHYLRIGNPVNPDVLTTYSHRLSSNRGNPYPVPGWLDGLAGGLSVFDSGLCTSNPQPSIGSTIDPGTQSILRGTYYTSTPGGPPCKAQPALGGATGTLGSFPPLQPLR